MERLKKAETSKTKTSQDLEANLKEAEAMAFHLHQTIRSLTIQLDEEKEARVDLEIENTKLRKEVTKLKKSMEMLNNNYYDAEDLNLSEVSIIMSEENDITTVGGDNSPSLLEIIQNPFSWTAATAARNLMFKNVMSGRRRDNRTTSTPLVKSVLKCSLQNNDKP